MDVELPEGSEVGDRRVRRSRSALLSAAVRVVTERETTEVSVTELAEAADVSRRVLYQHFGDRDTLLAAAAVDLVTRELLPRLPHEPEAMAETPVLARHFAEHRRFYRAVLTGSCAHAATRAVSGLFHPLSTASARRLFGGIDDQVVGEVADFFTGGTVMALSRWLVEGPEPLDPQEFTERLLRIQSVLTGPPAAPTPERIPHEKTAAGQPVGPTDDETSAAHHPGSGYRA
ncbi:TetR/AcrR family transcriptional regulator [Streptosporangium roseum]|uniref:TetR/AcrR family transcriptional regulator n=1 Tax=Streptosporangium roseum TaxID=2001 RepID=UPI00332002D3